MKTTFNGTPLMDLFDKLPEINEEADKENVRVFGQYGITYSGANKTYLCFMR